MQRSWASLLVALGVLTPALGAQTQSPAQGLKTPGPNAIGFGLVATLGANWQIESGEIGYVRRRSHGFAAIGVAGRLGTFVNESAMMGSNQGVVFSATLSARTPMKSIAQLGADERGTGIGFDPRSPLALGSHWAAVSVLPAFSIGSGDSPHFAIVIGPTVFLHSGKPLMRGLLAFRGEAPLARRERHP